jgi:UDP-GlcNAc:undecaprenyl-phosphate/decaprenyl-phosphate GlcNAc-1-phosphate transferase
MNVAALGAALGLGVAAGWLGARAMLASVHRRGAPVDLPDERRLHQAPTPRGGGVGILAAGVAALALAAAMLPHTSDRLAVALLVWAMPMGLLGIVDDYRAMPRAPKLVLQVASATAAVALGLRVDAIAVPPLGALHDSTLGAVFSVLWLVWSTNLFNFMDGLDALAGLCGVVFAAAIAAIAVGVGADDVALVAVALGGGLLGFVRHNVPPAAIFMGDGGSLFTGALLGGLGLVLASAPAHVPISALALAIGIFLFDATYTIVRRAVRRESLRPHRTHLYQRLIVAGISHRAVLALYVGLALVGATAAVATVRGDAVAQGVALAAGVAAALVLVVITTRAERQRT